MYIRLGQHDHTSLTVPKIRHKLGIGTGIDGRCTPATSDALGETLRSPGDTDGAGAGDAACDGKKILVLHVCVERFSLAYIEATVLGCLYTWVMPASLSVRAEIVHPTGLRRQFSHNISHA